MRKHSNRLKPHTHTHTRTSTAATTIANNLDSCIVVTFKCGTIVYTIIITCVCSMGAIFVNVTQSEREIERQ